MGKIDKVLIVGTTPESAGIGGVTIHIQRLLQWLDLENFAYDLCDYKKLGLLEQFGMMRKHKIAHIHISKPLPRLVYIMYCRLVGTKSILTVHGNIGRFNWLKNQMDKLSVRICDVPILINSNSFEKAKKWNKDSVLLSVFLPPTDDGYLPEYAVKAIAGAKAKGMEVVSSNASVMSFTDGGEEIYGINFAIDFFKYKPEYFFCVSDPSGQYAEKYRDEKFDNILFINERHSFYKLMKLSDVMLRPTATDGDALSVKEGLYLDKKVVATNRVDRPEGVLLFEYNNADSLAKALRADKLTNHSLRDEKVVESLRTIYKRLSNK